MKAIRISKYGGPEVLKLEEIVCPVPGPDEILVKIFASGVNPVDWVIRNGANETLRPHLKLPMTLGWDAAGIVESTGTEVTTLKKGDSVYGVPNFPGDGSYAEYCLGKAAQFALKPKSLNFNEAASVPLAALTAWTALFEYAKLQSKERVIIHGASGGVGSFAVQFAKAKGAHVTGIASTNNLQYILDLGADEVIDYKTQKFEDLLQEAAIFLEASPIRNNQERIKALGTLKQNGRFVSVNTDLPFDDDFLDEVRKRKLIADLSSNQPRQEWLTKIAELIDDKKVTTFISKIYPLEQVAEAHLESESWHVRGKLVLEVRKEETSIE